MTTTLVSRSFCSEHLFAASTFWQRAAYGGSECHLLAGKPVGSRRDFGLSFFFGRNTLALVGAPLENWAEKRANTPVGESVLLGLQGPPALPCVSSSDSKGVLKPSVEEQNRDREHPLSGRPCTGGKRIWPDWICQPPAIPPCLSGIPRKNCDSLTQDHCILKRHPISCRQPEWGVGPFCWSTFFKG